ncbi:hypothetical protein [Ferrimicrobium sp.]|uniref:hypothetical protein n=1 Tax=Ferrimicrobium sp. TaxID=2926050 RepID=UPI0026069530|nr:hypothetical protein [Ferrimicrobium sp.]
MTGALKVHLTTGFDAKQSCTRSIRIPGPVLGMITFSIGPVPVVIVPRLSFDTTLHLTGQANYTTSIDQTVSLTAGLNYTSSHGLVPVARIAHQGHADGFHPTVEGQTVLSLAPELEFLFYDVGGPALEAPLDLTFSASLTPTRSWRLTSGLQATLALDIPVFGFNKAASDLFGKTWVLDQSANPASAEAATNSAALTSLTTGVWSVGSGILTPLPAPWDLTPLFLDDDTCLSSSFCVTFGGSLRSNSSVPGGAPGPQIVYTYANGSWGTPEELPPASDGLFGYNGLIACANPTYCVIVEQDNGAGYIAFVMRSGVWGGPIPIPAHSAPVALGCPSDNVCAINTANGHSYLLIGNNWSGPHGALTSIVASGVPAPPEGSSYPTIPAALPDKSAFPSIPNLQYVAYSCIQPTSCAAIATSAPFSGASAASGSISSVYVYSDGTWAKTHQFRNAVGAYSALSCVSGPLCLAVGGYGDSDSTPWFSVYHG